LVPYSGEADWTGIIRSFRTANTAAAALLETPIFD
jgi:hypothetical protein